MNTKTLAAIALWLALIPALAAAGEDTPAPGYTGTWVRNDDLSDDPAEVLGHGGGDRTGQGRGAGMGRGGMGRSGMGRGGAMKGGGDRPPADRRPPRLMAGQQRLEIFHEGDEFAVTDADDVLLSYRLGGDPVERWTERGRVFDTAAMGDEGVVVRSRSEDDSRTVTYVLDESGDRLTVRHVFTPPGRKNSVTLRMVYDRAG